MAHVVFLRSVNVGGHKTFKPSRFIKGLEDLHVSNLGAAGTFVVTGKIAAGAVRARFVEKLPFETQVMVCPGAALLRLIHGAPFGDRVPASDERRVVSILARAPRATPPLPLVRPPEGEWEVRILRVEGPFVMGLYRRLAKAVLYPNEVVEKAFGVPATTRAWNTIEKLGALLESPPVP